jgi:hypothetical protein
MMTTRKREYNKQDELDSGVDGGSDHSTDSGSDKLIDGGSDDGIDDTSDSFIEDDFDSVVEDPDEDYRPRCSTILERGRRSKSPASSSQDETKDAGGPVTDQSQSVENESSRKQTLRSFKNSSHTSSMDRTNETNGIPRPLGTQDFDPKKWSDDSAFDPNLDRYRDIERPLIEGAVARKEKSERRFRRRGGLY